MSDKPASPRVKLRRLPDRGHYDAASLHAVLDAGLICHVGFMMGDTPMVIPTAYWREGEHLYIHGSSKSGMAMALAKGAPACVTVSMLDGLVLARSAFHHSVNYRSAVILGRFFEVTEPEAKERGLEAFMEKLAPGRWAEIRAPNKQEMKATKLLGLELAEASVKIRSGPPKDDDEDMALRCWAGVVPLKQGFATPIPDPLLAPGIALPDYLKA